MVISCSAYGCSNKWSRETSVHFHKFPFRSEKLCKKWTSAMKRKNFVPTKASLVCSDHFRREDYIFKPGMRKRRLKSHAVPSIFNFPINYVPVEFVSKLDSPLQTKKGRKKRCEKRGRKRKSCIKQLSVTKLVEGFDEYDDTLIEETEIYENDESDCASNDDLIVESEDDALAYADEEDRCYLLGSMWADRLKLLPLDVRIIVRKLIDKVFDKAQTGSLTEDFAIVENS